MSSLINKIVLKDEGDSGEEASRLWVSSSAQAACQMYATLSTVEGVSYMLQAILGIPLQLNIWDVAAAALKMREGTGAHGVNCDTAQSPAFRMRYEAFLHCVLRYLFFLLG
jgi:hypothetical protein